MARTDQGRRPILRNDYQPPAWLVERVDLELKLDAVETRVRAALSVRRNPAASDTAAPLTLYGAGLETLAVEVDERPLAPAEYQLDGERMVIAPAADQARVVTEVLIRPDRNTALEGLYQAGQSLLTQCEAEGFRKITWFPDRPDVMARFRVRLEADRRVYPLLLSNGNLIEVGQCDEHRHYAVWDDPFPKPSYLFALVAGDLAVLESTYRTASGREVALKIYSEPANLGQLDHAMESLKRSMAWDEQRYGLDYDLDVYHIVATHDFNMGAMENKSLNIFNSRYVLADRETATDADFEAVEAVIAHEYFHNWTGNRVTCRDWFQLTLKEGLTVFRDQEFTADQRSRAVKRIDDVARLMAHQFPEDAGPMAHSVRPERYVEINNFYTATVYEKGAEVVRMYQTLLGIDGFRRGMDLYFERHDGQAVTCDDFLAAMADANQQDLGQFARWYAQVGTPRLEVQSDYDSARGEFILRFRQALPDHADNRELGPLMIPVKLGFLDAGNQPLPVTLAGDSEPGSETRLLVLTEAESEYRFRDLPADALPSLLRDFSAPVALDYDWSLNDLARLAGHDPDAFNRWRASRRLAERVLADAVAEGGKPASLALLEQAWAAILTDSTLDPALAAELLSLPSEQELIQQQGEAVDIDAVCQARAIVADGLAEALLEPLQATHDGMRDTGPWSSDGPATARRRLKNLVLSLLCRVPGADGADRAWRQFESADNMTDRLAALRCLVFGDDPRRDDALAAFERRFGHDPLVMDKWLAVQASRPDPATVETVIGLMDHPVFSLTNPNKVRALIGAFSQNNPQAFHRADGAGYRLLGQVIARLDELNPQVAARLATAFNRWRRYGEPRSPLIEKALKAIAARQGLSPDVEEIVRSSLK